MNNKFWNAPAWSLGNRFKGTFFITKASKPVMTKAPISLGLVPITCISMDTKQDGSIN
jgi:hypothetical protein